MSYSQKIDVPNVVVSFINRPLTDAIQFIKSGARENSGYLFRIPNDNIIKFTHSFNFNKSEGDDIGAKITLETIDPEGVFESTLFGNSGELPFSDSTLKKLRDDAYADILKRVQLREKLEKFDFSSIQFFPEKQDSLVRTVSEDSTYYTLKLGKVSLGNDLQSYLGDKELADSIIKKLEDKKNI